MTIPQHTATGTYLCGSCFHEADGYSKQDLQTEGWTWHRTSTAPRLNNTQYFVLCDTCTRRYQPIWEARQQAAA